MGKVTYGVSQQALHALPGAIRGYIADYGVPLMVLAWTGISYAPTGSVPHGIPRRLFSPNPWSQGATAHWTVIKVWNFVYLELKFLGSGFPF